MSITEARRLDLEPGQLGIDLVTADGGPSILFLSGEIDAATIGWLDAAFDELLATGDSRTVTIDFRDVTFMDSSGINAILDLRNRLVAGVRLHLRACSAAVRRVCDITGLAACEDLTIS